MELDEQQMYQLQTDKLNLVKLHHNINLISMQFYFAFMNKYNFVIESDGEEKITKFIVKHITKLLTQDEKEIFPDAEFQDYYIAYVSSYVYDFEIINEEAIADLIMRRYNEYKLIYIDDGSTEEEAWEACFRKEYTTHPLVLKAIGPSYDKFDNQIYADAIEYIIDNIEYYQLYTMLMPDKLEEVLRELFTEENSQFLALFEIEVPQVLLSCDKKLKLSIPNLIMSTIEIFLTWQQEHIIVNC